jgi:2',3'-cyclic-nucleotide 2'-phosphodiesterase (5'-nucleotidase family)
MKKFFGLQIVLMFLLAGCAKQYVSTQYQYTKNQIESKGEKDSKISAMISPYKDSLEKTMNNVVVVNEKAISKGQPESELGNLLADVLLQQANNCCNKQVDVSILNNGGIRIPQLAAGKVTLGKIYEIMPFDNRLVLMDLSGKELKELFNAIAAAGGWPMSGARFTIANKKATEIFVGGVPLNENKTYTIGLSDYLTEGGDNLSMLKGKPITDSGKNIREAFIDAFTAINKKGKKLTSSLDERIKE